MKKRTYKIGLYHKLSSVRCKFIKKESYIHWIYHKLSAL